MGQTQIQVIKRPIQKMNIKMKFKKCQRVKKKNYHFIDFVILIKYPVIIHTQYDRYNAWYLNCKKKNNIPGIAGSVTCSFVEYTAFYLFLLQEAHVNTCYKHFYYFVTEYNLVDKKELEPLVSSYSKQNPKSILLIRNVCILLKILSRL